MVTTVSQLKIFIIIQIRTSSALYQNILFPIVVNIICHHRPAQLLRVSENLFNLWFCHQSNDFYAGATRHHLPQVNFYFLLRKWVKQLYWLIIRNTLTLKTVLFGLNCFKSEISFPAVFFWKWKLRFITSSESKLISYCSQQKTQQTDVFSSDSFGNLTLFSVWQF